MARRRNPSGIPAKRIVRPVTRQYSDEEFAVGFENRADGFRRVRRSLLVATSFVLALVLLLVAVGRSETAAGVTGLLLTPLVVFVVGAHVCVLVTRPKKPESWRAR